PARVESIAAGEVRIVDLLQKRTTAGLLTIAALVQRARQAVQENHRSKLERIAEQCSHQFARIAGTLEEQNSPRDLIQPGCVPPLGDGFHFAQVRAVGELADDE